MKRTKKVAGAVDHYFRQWRKYRGLTVYDVAARTGLTHSFISQLERGYSRFSADTLRKLSDAYGVTRGELLDVCPPKPGEKRGEGGQAERLALAVLLFNRGGPWTKQDSALWASLMGSNDEATTKTLCNLARAIMMGAAKGDTH